MIVSILYNDGSVRGAWQVDNDFICRACELEVELHNRDFPEDEWSLIFEE